MENSLYVGNLSEDVSVDLLRKRFSECGPVVDVQLPIDRASGRLRGHAFVIMAAAAGVQAALSRLNGVELDGRPLRIRIAGEDRRSQPQGVEPARITSQFRERLNMSYELECAGHPLLIKIYHQDGPTDARRVEASTKRPAGQEPMVLSASATTRALALADIARAWSEGPATAGVVLDWPAITNAMERVRAI